MNNKYPWNDIKIIISTILIEILSIVNTCVIGLNLLSSVNFFLVSLLLIFLIIFVAVLLPTVLIFRFFYNNVIDIWVRGIMLSGIATVGLFILEFILSIFKLDNIFEIILYIIIYGSPVVSGILSIYFIIHSVIGIIYYRINRDVQTDRTGIKESKIVEDKQKELDWDNQQKGIIGEKLVINKLNNVLENFPSIILNDLYFYQYDNGGTTQIDHIVITTVGVYVIETKNFVGEIFGMDEIDTWLQRTDNGDYEFYSPVKQNYGHVKYIKKLLPKTRVRSVIVFTNNDCDLCDIDTHYAWVGKVADLDGYFKYELKEIENSISTDEMLEISDILEKNNITDISVRKAHIEKTKVIAKTPTNWAS